MMGRSAHLRAEQTHGDKRKLRVVHLAEGGGWAGIEVHLLNLLPELESGGDVDSVFVAFERGRLLEALRVEGLGVELIDRRRRLDVGVFLRLVKLLRGYGPDIVHMHGYLAILFGTPAAAVAGVRTRIVTLHASPNLAADEGLKLRLLLWATYAVMKVFGARSIAVSGDVLQSHVEVRGMNRQHMQVVHNGIDAEGIGPQGESADRADLGLPERGFLVGMVGRIDKNKGHVYLLTAVAKLLAERSDIFVVVVGDGPERTSLMEFCANAGIDEHVSFVGFQANATAYMSNLDAMVIASMHEGIPYTLLEAMAVGVPVVATAVGGIPEVVEDSVSGLLIQPGDPEAIAASLTRLASDPGLRARLAHEASEVVRHRFSQQRMAEATVDAYRHNLTDRIESSRARWGTFLPFAVDAKWKAVKRKIAAVGVLQTIGLILRAIARTLTGRKYWLYCIDLDRYLADMQTRHDVSVHRCSGLSDLTADDCSGIVEYSGEGYLRTAEKRFAMGWTLFLASREQDLAGGAWTLTSPSELKSSPAVPFDEGDVAIVDCWTIPKHRGAGVFPALLRLIVERSKENGLKRALIEVERGNRSSIRGIEKAGFERTETAP